MAMNPVMKRPFRVATLLVIVLATLIARALRAGDESSHPTVVKILLTIAGVALVGGTGFHLSSWLRSHGAQRKAQGMLLLTYVGLALAGVLYFFTTPTGMGWIGQGDLAKESAAKYDTIMTIAMALVAMCAFIPAVMMEATVSTWHAVDDAGVEMQRTREVGLAGLSIALAAAFLMVTCNVAREKNIKKDLSYFRTSDPGDSTRKLVEAMSTPVRVLLFFPEHNPVGEEVEAYFQELGRTTKKIGIEHHDRLLSKTLAEKYQVQKDGTVVLVRGADKDEKFSKFDLDTDFEKARRQTGKLRILDQTVNTELLKLLRDKRKVYLTVGHGEINDPDSLPPNLRGKLPDGRAQVIKNILTQLNYEQKKLGAIDGLASEIPADATFVMVLGPKTAFDPAELDALARYLDRGGNLLVAMDPRGDFRLGPLEGRLGVGLGELRPGQPERIGIVTDDKNFLPTRRTDTDRQLALTNQFSSHASTTSLSRGAANQGILLETAGALFDRPFVAPEGAKRKRTYVVRTMGDSWLDYDDNYTFGGDEKRSRYNIGAAIEGPKPQKSEDNGDAASDDGDKTEKAGFRAMVFSDQDLFADHAIQSMNGQVFIETNGRALPIDAIKWLGGEENISGIVNNEKETELKQTPQQAATWFTATIVIAPFGVLGFGLLIASRSRRKPNKTSKTASKENAS